MTRQLYADFAVKTQDNKDYPPMKNRTLVINNETYTITPDVLKGSVENQLIDVVFADIIDLNGVRNLLLANADPDAPIKLVSLPRFTGYRRVMAPTDAGTDTKEPTYTRTIITVRLLHLVKNENVMRLLLKHEADPNRVASYSGSENFENLVRTPIEFAAVRGEYDKVRALASFVPCRIRTPFLNNAIMIIMQKKDFKNSIRAKEAVDVLIRKSADLNAYPYKAFDKAIELNKVSVVNHMMLFNSNLMSRLARSNEIEPRNGKIEKCIANKYDKNLKRYNEIHDLCMVWIMLKRDNAKKESGISMLSYELLLKIMFYACKSNPVIPPGFFEYVTETSSAEHVSKVEAFKKIYTVMDISDTKPHKFLKNNSDYSPVRMIRKIQEKIHADPEGMTTTAWHLACQHHDNCTGKNTELIKRLIKFGTFCESAEDHYKRITDTLDGPPSVKKSSPRI